MLQLPIASHRPRIWFIMPKNELDLNFKHAYLSGMWQYVKMIIFPHVNMLKNKRGLNLSNAVHSSLCLDVRNKSRFSFFLFVVMRDIKLTFYLRENVFFSVSDEAILYYVFVSWRSLGKRYNFVDWVCCTFATGVFYWERRLSYLRPRCLRDHTSLHVLWSQFLKIKFMCRKQARCTILHHTTPLNTSPTIYLPASQSLEIIRPLDFLDWKISRWHFWWGVSNPPYTRHFFQVKKII